MTRDLDGGNMDDTDTRWRITSLEVDTRQSGTESSAELRFTTTAAAAIWTAARFHRCTPTHATRQQIEAVKFGNNSSSQNKVWSQEIYDINNYGMLYVISVNNFNAETAL